MCPCDSVRNKDIILPQQQETARCQGFLFPPSPVQAPVATVGTNEARCENCCRLSYSIELYRAAPLRRVSAPDTGSCPHQRPHSGGHSVRAAPSPSQHPAPAPACCQHGVNIAAVMSTNIAAVMSTINIKCWVTTNKWKVFFLFSRMYST